MLTAIPLKRKYAKIMSVLKLSAFLMTIVARSVAAETKNASLLTVKKTNSALEAGQSSKNATNPLENVSKSNVSGIIRVTTFRRQKLGKTVQMVPVSVLRRPVRKKNVDSTSIVQEKKSDVEITSAKR